jgi:hypothetical protein
MSRRGRPLLALTMLLGVLAMVQVAAAPRAGETDAPAADEKKTFLPIVTRAITATITFGATVNNNGIPTPPITHFPAGSRKMYYNAAIVGGAGKSYRLEWTLNGTRTPSIDRSGVISGSPSNINGLICYTQVGTSCDNPTGTLPAGTYTVVLYVNNTFIAQGTATVAAGQQTAAEREKSGDRVEYMEQQG